MPNPDPVETAAFIKWTLEVFAIAAPFVLAWWLVARRKARKD